MKSITSYILENIEQAERVNGFCILKPDFLQYTNDWIKQINDNGWQIINKKEIQLNTKTTQELYISHKDKDFYDELCKYMSSGKCICCTCYKDCKDPINDMSELKEKIRKQWGKDEMKNAMHSSDSLENVKREAKIIFNKLV